MGRALAESGLSYYIYKDQKKRMDDAAEDAAEQYAESEKEAENMKKMKAAEGEAPDTVGIESELAKGKKGVQSTFHASKGQ